MDAPELAKRRNSIRGIASQLIQKPDRVTSGQNELLDGPWWRKDILGVNVVNKIEEVRNLLGRLKGRGKITRYVRDKDKAKGGQATKIALHPEAKSRNLCIRCPRLHQLEQLRS